MNCTNTGGTLVFGDEKGNTVFMRTGESCDVPDAIFEQHRDKLKVTGKDGKFVNQITGKEEKVDPGKEPEVMTGQQRSASTRAHRTAEGSGKTKKTKTAEE